MALRKIPFSLPRAHPCHQGGCVHKTAHMEMESRAGSYQIAVCLFEYFIHTTSKAIYHCIHNSFISLTPLSSRWCLEKAAWNSTQSLFFILLFFLINHRQEGKFSLRLLITQIVLNSKHDVYYIARFRKRALSLSFSPFATMKWRARRREFVYFDVKMIWLTDRLLMLSQATNVTLKVSCVQFRVFSLCWRWCDAEVSISRVCAIRGLRGDELRVRVLVSERSWWCDWL